MVGAVRNLQVGGRNGDALFPQVGNFALQVMGVDDHTVAHDAHNVGPQNARGQQVQDELAPLILDGVAGIVAALVTDHDVIILAEQVHHAALALVAPVDPGDCSKHN